MTLHIPLSSYEQQLIAGYKGAGERLRMVPAPKPAQRPGLIHVRPDANNHVLAWRRWQKMYAQGTMPAEFIRLACEVLGYDRAFVLSHRRTRAAVLARYELIRMTSERYPKFSSPKLGKLFNRDHTVVLYALNKDSRARKNTAKLTPDQVRQIKARARTGKEYLKDIAAEFGVVPSTISNIAHGRVWRGVD